MPSPQAPIAPSERGESFEDRERAGRRANDRSVRIDADVRQLLPGFQRVERVGDVILTKRACRILKDAPEGSVVVFREVRREPVVLFALAGVE